MKNFTYYQPKTVESAIGLLADRWGQAELLAGGTSLLDLMKEYISGPDRLVSLTAVSAPEMNTIAQESSGAVSIGALVKIAAIAENETLRKSFPALTAAASTLGGPQIRNMGTLGGNLCQRNTCWYFRDEHVSCLLKGGRRCFAAEGENQHHAIFTKGHPCVIAHPSSLAPALIALGATAHISGAQRTRTVPLSEFFQAPSRPDQREHVLAANEVLTRVTIPSAGTANGSYEVRQKQSHDWPLVQAAVSFKLEGGRASQAVVALGYVAPTPYVATAAGAALNGKTIDEAAAAAAGKAAVQGAEPLTQNAYKVRLAEIAVMRAVLIAAGVKPYWEV